MSVKQFFVQGDGPVELSMALIVVSDTPKAAVSSWKEYYGGFGRTIEFVRVWEIPIVDKPCTMDWESLPQHLLRV